jgi:hypothetical protein
MHDGIFLELKVINELVQLLRKPLINYVEISIATWTHHIVFGSPDDESGINLQVVDPQLDTDDREGEDDPISALHELRPVTDDDELEWAASIGKVWIFNSQTGDETAS